MSIVNETPATVKDAKIAFQMLDLRKMYIDRFNVEYALKRARLDVLDFEPKTTDGEAEKDYILNLLNEFCKEVRDFYSSSILDNVVNAITKYKAILERFQVVERELASLRKM